MTKYFTKQAALDYTMIIVGTFLLAYAIIAFWYPHHLVTGGVSGLAIIVSHYSIQAGREIPIWLTTTVVNIPLFLLGFRALGKTYFVRSLIAAGMMSFWLFVSEFLPPPQTDLFLSAVFGGVVGGIGVGLILRAMATSGGTTLAAAIVKEKLFPQWSVAKILLVVDSTVIVAGLVIFGPIYTMYALVAVYVLTKVTDLVVEGMGFAKAAYIISKQNELLASEIMANMQRGVTEISSRGMFTKSPQPMLMCVVASKELPALKQLVHSIDQNAFVIVSDVKEVLGEGFTKHEIKKSR